MDKIKVISTLKNRVTVDVPDIRFSRTWPTAGASVNIDKDTLEELMYDAGFANMIKMGILFIEDMDFKKEIGLEPEDATEPVNLILLNDKEKKYYLTGLSLVGFKDKLKKLSKNQIEELADYAIQNKLVDIEKCKIIKEACGRDVVRAIQLLEADKEA
jgi:uncharacterized protein Smg (DUF494 family)